MQRENSHFPDIDLQAQLQLLRWADQGTLDSLQCPHCHESSMNVWFTHPSEEEYRTWFVCTNCSCTIRAQNSGRPHYFSEERVNGRLETYDAHILSNKRL